jgi:GcrA cell cycle regulator
MRNRRRSLPNGRERSKVSGMERTTMAWNDERVELLKKLWSEGLSASQIAGRLGGVTRNAVIGKVHRLGLSGRATTSRMKSHRPRARVGQQQKQQQLLQAKRPNKARFQSQGNPAVRSLYQLEAEPFVSAAEELDIPLKERRSIATLTDCSCRWPIGDPQLADFHFCNRDKVAGLPYCEFHARRAFQPPQPRRRDIRDPSAPASPAYLPRPAKIEPAGA